LTIQKVHKHKKMMKMEKKKILIVEDEKIVALDLKTILNNLGYEVIEPVNTGKDAINAAKKFKPDSILMDISLVDEMNGIEAANQIKKFSDIPIIFLTGKSDKKTLESARMSDPIAYLVKPFDENQIKITMELAISKNVVEKKLKENYQLLSTTLKSVGDGIIATDKNGRVKFINTVAEKITGWKEEDATGRDLKEVFNVINQYTRERVENPVEKVFREARIIGLANDQILISRNGGEFNIEDSAYPIYDSEGKISGAVLTFHDISEIYNTRKNLRMKEEQNHNIIESALNAFVMIDDAGTIIEWNFQAEQIFGWRKNEIIGEKIDETIIPPKYRESHKRGIKNFFETGERTFLDKRIEISALTREGDEIDVELTITTIKAGNSYNFASFIRDITEYKQIEKFVLSEMYILEMAAQNVPYLDLLETLIKSIEEINKDTFGSILFLEPDKVTIRCGPAPSIPDEYSEQINGLRIGPKAGSCGTAMYKKLPVIVSNIEKDPIWKNYKNIALKYGFKACSSFPILTKDNEVLGSFAFYYKKVKSPQDKEIEFMARAANIASILITKNMSDKKLKESEERLSQIFNSTSELMALLKIEGKDDYRMLSCNKSYINEIRKFQADITEDDLIGKKLFSILKLVLKEEDEIIRIGMMKIYEAIKTEKIIKFELAVKVPLVTFYEVIINPIFDDKGEGTRLLLNMRNITDQKKAEESYKSLIKEKEGLLKKTHHRVKNNMQLISSLINLQVSQIGDAKTRELFLQVKNRIKTLALLHEALYQADDLEKINLKAYLESLISSVSSTIGAENIKFSFDIAELYVDINTGIPLGLIINELVSNALTHAFPEGKSGLIKVNLKETGDFNYQLVISDNGVGLQKNINIKNPETLGLQLVNSLVEQIKGKIEYISEKGTTCIITFN
jgi:PAS domain S-box-containing protein